MCVLSDKEGNNIIDLETLQMNESYSINNSKNYYFTIKPILICANYNGNTTKKKIT